MPAEAIKIEVLPVEKETLVRIYTEIAEARVLIHPVFYNTIVVLFNAYLIDIGVTLSIP